MRRLLLATKRFLVAVCAAGLLLLLTVAVSSAQFQRADRPWDWQFPRDHGSHPDFQTEWWYFTGVLQAEDGHEFGYELTFFRFALREDVVATSSAWRTRDLILAHFAITDVTDESFHLEEALQRAAAGLAGAAEGRLHVWADAWSVQQEGDVWRLEAGNEQSVRLTLRPQRQPVRHGENGLSWKSADKQHASYYYSQPRLQTEGTLQWNGRRLEVQGTTWMDHEFFTGDTPVQGVGWDWFSCRLDDGRDLMLYLLRYPDGTRYRSGTLVEVDGRSRSLDVTDMVLEPLRTWTSPHTQATYPVAWSILLPAEQLELQVEARLDEQEVYATQTVGFAYWEGLSRFKGRLGDRELSGQGYVELTGYDAH